LLIEIYWLLPDRDELKLVSHGRKLNNLRLPHDRIQVVVELSSLVGLVGLITGITTGRSQTLI